MKVFGALAFVLLVTTTPALAAVTHAIVDALAEFGVRHIEMPATPEEVREAEEEGERGEAEEGRAERLGEARRELVLGLEGAGGDDRPEEAPGSAREEEAGAECGRDREVRADEGRQERQVGEEAAEQEERREPRTEALAARVDEAGAGGARRPTGIGGGEGERDERDAGGERRTRGTRGGSGHVTGPPGERVGDDRVARLDSKAHPAAGDRDRRDECGEEKEPAEGDKVARVAAAASGEAAGEEERAEGELRWLTEPRCDRPSDNAITFKVVYSRGSGIEVFLS